MANLYSEVVDSQKAVLNILLLEKQAGNAILIRDLLDNSPSTECIISHSDSIHEAVRLLDELSFDVIICDIAIVHNAAPRIISEWQTRFAHIPILFLSDLEDEYECALLAKKYDQDYLVKQNLSPTYLLRSVRFAIERNWMMEQLEKARKIEKHLAYHDVLTGLPNRQLFLDRLEQILKQAVRREHMVSILSLDLDGFKRINDTLGHGIGDHILKIMSQRLRSCIRKSDTVARQGGDEFIIILNEIGNEKHAVTVAKKILTSLVEPINIDTHSCRLTCSIGVSIYPPDGQSASDLVKNAEIAMHRAKKQGKNTYQLYNLSMDAEALERLELENNLHLALEQREFKLLYQPKLNLITGQIEGVEALVRWSHPTLGSISPDKFIPLAEETGLIEQLGEWVLHSACIHAKTLIREGFPGIRFSVNLSNKQFRNKHIHEMIEQILNKTGLAPEFLGLEITESSVMKDVGYTIKVLRRLKEKGIKIFIDDFGTGYSSLSYLKKLPIDVLKVDRSFLEGIPDDRENQSITSAIIFLAHNLGMQVVAEGVETPKQLSFLRSMRCNYIQGFLFSKPIDFEDLKLLLREYKNI